jgi:hypothetical protein
MFLISHRLNESYLYKTFYLLNAGIAGLVLTKYLYPNAILEGIFWLVIIIGIVYYFFYVNDSYQKRMKKTLDVGMRYTMLALVFLAAPIILSLLLILLQDSSQTEWLQRVAMLYGLSMVFGFFTTIALGQTYKTLPFIIWLEKYQKLVGKFHTPLPRELYNEKIADIQFYVYMAFLTVTIFAIFLQIELLIQIATVLFLIVTVLYNYNVWKMFFHDSEKYINQRENEILNKQN